jgi:hypothetical protein
MDMCGHLLKILTKIQLSRRTPSSFGTIHTSIVHVAKFIRNQSDFGDTGQGLLVQKHGAPFTSQKLLMIEQ